MSPHYRYLVKCKTVSCDWSWCCVPPCSTEIQPMSQQDCSATRPYRGLVLDTHAITVSKLGCTNLIFVEPWAKVNSQHYWDMLLMQVLPAIHSIAEDMFLFQQDNAPAHRARDTVELLHCETPVHQSWHVASQQSWPQPGRLLRLGHAARARASSTNPQHGRVAEASCWDTGWISAECGWQCSWSVGKETGSMYPCRRWSLWTLDMTLFVWHSSCHTPQPALLEPPLPTHNSLFSAPPTFGGKQHYLQSDEKVLYFPR